MKYIKYLLTFGAVNFLLIKSAKTMLSDSESANTKSGTTTLTSSGATAAASGVGAYSAGSSAGAATCSAAAAAAAAASDEETKPKLSLPEICRANEAIKASLYHKLPAQLKEACEYKPNANTTINTQEIEIKKEHNNILELLNTLYALDNIIITFHTQITPFHSKEIDRYESFVYSIADEYRTIMAELLPSVLEHINTQSIHASKKLDEATASAVKIIQRLENAIEHSQRINEFCISKEQMEYILKERQWEIEQLTDEAEPNFRATQKQQSTNTLPNFKKIKDKNAN